MSLDVIVDHNRCIGSGNCAFWLPNAFALDEDDLAHVVDKGSAPPDRLREIARSCPTLAITVTETGEHSHEK